MLTLEQAVTIQILHQQGKSIKAISRELRVSRNTVRKYLRQKETPQYRRTQPRTSMIYAELSGDFPLGDSRQPTYKSLRPFDLVS